MSDVISTLVDVDEFEKTPTWIDLVALLNIRINQAREVLSNDPKYANLMKAQETQRFAEEILDFPEGLRHSIKLNNTINQQEEN